MSPAWTRAAAGVFGLLLAAAAGAVAEPPEAQAERQRIKAERAAVESTYRQAEAECRRHFAVSSCVSEAQAQRREALAKLRQRELVLDEAKRKAQAEEDERRIAAKRAEAASKAAPVPRAASAPAAKAAKSAASAPVAGERTHKLSKTGEDATEAAARVAAQQRRLAEAAAHRQEVEQRNAERATHGKKSAPLPVPSAASVAGIASASAR